MNKLIDFKENDSWVILNSKSLTIKLLHKIHENAKALEIAINNSSLALLDSKSPKNLKNQFAYSQDRSLNLKIVSIFESINFIIKS